MDKLHSFRVFLKERLMATALEIFCAFEQMSVEFQEENNRLKSILRIPTEIRFSGVDFLQYSPSEEKVPPEKHHWKQEWSSSLWQQDPGHKQIKEEQEELNQWLLESKDSILTPSCVKSEYEQEGTKQADINRLNSSQELPFRAFLMKYLTELAAAEIFGSVEKTISKYQEENYQLCRMMRSFPEIKLARIDSLQFSLSELDVFPEQQNCDQDWSSSLGQEDPEPTQIKEEQEELRTSQEEELNQGLLDNKDSILTPPCVKSEYDQDDSSQSLVLPETQTVEKSESDFTPLNLQQSDTMTHPKGPDISSEPPDNPDHLSRLSPDMNSDQYGLEPGPPMRRPHCSKARVVLIKVHCCRDCGASFFLEANLQKHVNLFSNKSSECGFCKQQFNSRCKLKAHVQRCQVDQLCSVCGQTVNMKVLPEHMKMHTKDKLFSCPFCCKTFKRKAYLTIHIRLHTGEKPYSCGVCGKAFNQKWQFDVHKQIHSGEKQFSCDDCGKSFSLKGNLTVHKLTHTKEKRFTCDECGKSFGLKDGLCKHKLIHTGEKPFTCGDCGKSFSHKGNLNMHKITHTGEKPFTCGDCGKSFKHKGNLTVHKVTHTGEKPFSCGDCGKSFSLKKNLNTHAMIHTGEKLFSCKYCGESFQLKASLTRHELKHTGTDSYVCSVCAKVFSTKTHLLTHMGNKHREFKQDLKGEK